MNNPGYDGFLWFLGIVDSIDDPKKLGRVKVRLITEYTPDKVGVDDIPWAMVMTPTTSPSFLGIGSNPSLLPGSRVVGFFLDGVGKTKPMIIGTFPIINNGNEEEHSLSRQARGVGTVLKEVIPFVEPENPFKAEYPYNKTTTTLSGHMVEMDDTPGQERIHIYHKSGAYIEMHQNGDIVTKSPEKSVSISVKDNTIYAQNGTISLIANEGEILMQSQGAIVIKSDTAIALESPVISLNGN